jgi:hypothetical protein
MARTTEGRSGRRDACGDDGERRDGDGDRESDRDGDRDSDRDGDGDAFPSPFVIDNPDARAELTAGGDP